MEPKEPRMSAEDLERTLEEYTKEMTPDFLRKRLRLALYKKVQAGDISALDDLEKLDKFEARVTPGAAPPASSTQAASPATATGEAAPPSEACPGTTEAGEDEIGIPQRLRVKRHYTVSAAVIERNKKNGAARRPGSEGNKRNWKGGLFAQDFIQGRIKPCQSTCPLFDECELVSEGYTKPDGVCLDKASVIATYSAIMTAIKDKKYDDFNEVSGLMVAETMHVCQTMMDDIFRDGTVVKREKYDKEGRLHSIEYVPHPNLMGLPKIIADLGLTPRELNITPKAIKDDKNKEEENETLGKILGRVGTMIKQSEAKKEPEADT